MMRKSPRQRISSTSRPCQIDSKFQSPIKSKSPSQFKRRSRQLPKRKSILHQSLHTFSTSPQPIPLPSDLNSKIAVVTGGSRGIGFATVEHLLQRGCSVVYCSKTVDSINAAATRLSTKFPTFRPTPPPPTQSPQTALYISPTPTSQSHSQFFTGLSCDVSNEVSIQQFFSSLKLLRAHTPEGFPSFAFPGADLLINCAGITANRLLLSTPESTISNIMATNVTGTLLMTKHFIKQLPVLSTTSSTLPTHQQYYRVVSISSIIGKQGNAGQSAYAASKAAVDGFTRSMAKEMATFRSTPITFNAVSPGYIQTDMTSDNVTPELLSKIVDKVNLKRIGQPEEVANVIGFLASPNSSYINGQSLSVDGGM